MASARLFEMTWDPTSPERQRILVVEDDADIRAGVAEALRRAGWTVDEADRVEAADAAWTTTDYDVVVADRLLPDGDMLVYVTERRRDGDRVPVLFLTARDSLVDRARGLEAGDAYVTKPFAIADVLLRVRALARRSTTGEDSVVTLGDLEIDSASAEVRRAGVVLPLTAREQRVLLVLVDGLGDTIGPTELARRCLGRHDEPAVDEVEADLASLRRKLGHPDPIRTVDRGIVLVRP